MLAAGGGAGALVRLITRARALAAAPAGSAALATGALDQQARSTSSTSSNTSTSTTSTTSTTAAEAAASAASAAAEEARAAAAAAADALSPAEREQLRVAHYVLQRPARSALHAGLLTALAATHRDLHVALDALHKRDALGVARPLLDALPLPSAAAASKASAQAPPTPTQSFYPVRDLTRLPDAPEPATGPPLHMRGAYMGRGQGPWQQLLPNHVEVSYALGAAVPLWPAMEACFPMFLDFEAAIRQLRRGSSRGRVRAGARRRRRAKPYAVLVNTDARADRRAGGE